ncbi:tetratricopeptide repeat protein [Thiohalobacter sp. IOR34]|uniref:tetratricopeptide repeat protein n=1 Tax=Thiohalobacter sp. IOR34 TaxID=3057176 RepID=UPI0025AED06A|nr:tetratricopeptide repeat protein [Thiohalobacter sp. IOR34]WJW74594.1 tetratricopeptide repeat protein [Thiohalobacter sp. IOR34]
METVQAIARHADDNLLDDYFDERLLVRGEWRKIKHELNSLSPQLLRRLGDYFMRRNHADLAIGCYKTILRAGEATKQDRFAHASLLMQFRGMAEKEGQYADALEAFRELKEVSPTSLPALINIALYWMDAVERPEEWAGEVREAMALALQIAPGLPLCHYILGIVDEIEGDAKSAAQRYYHVLEMDPSYGAARIRLHWPDNWRFLDRKQRERLSSWNTDMPDVNELVVDRQGGSIEAARSVFKKFNAVIIRNMFADDAWVGIRQDYYQQLGERMHKDKRGMWLMEDVDQSLRGSVTRLTDEAGLESWLHGILGEKYDDWRFAEHHAWHIQRRDAGGEWVTPCHQDHPVFCANNGYATCWMPFDKCGDDRAPGLELFLDDIEHPILLQEQFPHMPLTLPTEFVHEYLEPKRLRPEFVPGDMLIFAPLVFHKTEALDAGAGGKRMSCDIRYKIGPTAWGFGEMQA